jgi:Tfp pilus assembly protein PilX
VVIGRLHRDERGQSLVIVLALVTVLFLLGSALAAHTSAALRTTVVNEAQAGDLRAADAGAELGMWWQRTGRSGDPPDITVNGLDVSTDVSISGTVPCPTPSSVLITGFEHGVVSASGGAPFSAVTGTGLAADTAVHRTGAYSLRVTDAAGAANHGALPVAAGVAVVRLYLRFPTLPTANVNAVIIGDAAAGNDLRLGYQASPSRLTVRLGNGTVTAGSVAISAGPWYRIDLRLVANTNPRTVAWQIDGVTQPGIQTNGAGSTVNTIRLGSTVAADAYTANYDDVFISAASGDYPIGSGTVVGLRPAAMGTSVGTGSFRNNDGSTISGTTWGRLDDSPMSSTADFVRQQTIGTADYVELTFGSTSANCVTGVSALLAYRSAGTPANDGATAIMDGSTARVVFDGDMSVTAIRYVDLIVAPAAGTWTIGAVNALRARIGFSSDVTPNPFWDALLLEVATGIYVPGTVTVSATAGGSTVTATYTDVGNAAPTLLTWTTTR